MIRPNLYSSLLPLAVLSTPPTEWEVSASLPRMNSWQKENPPMLVYSIVVWPTTGSRPTLTSECDVASRSVSSGSSPLLRFGGDPDQITIMGQSGGGFAIVSQLALYDGAKPNFQRACARSVQRSPMFTVAEHSVGNVVMQTAPPIDIAHDSVITGPKCPPRHHPRLQQLYLSNRLFQASRSVRLC
jgi:hypothetical protein